MKTQKRKPNWGRLFLLVPLMIGLLLVDTYLKLPSLGHQFIEVGVVILMYGAMAYWLFANQAALEAADDEAETWLWLDLEADQAPETAPLLTPAPSALLDRNGAQGPLVAEATLLAVELQHALQRPLLHCERPSGARLN